MTFETFLIFITIVYVLQVLVFLIGLGRVKDSAGGTTPFVSVVIAARNEEANLPSCLDSVLNQTYDSGKFEVVVVNDHSTDTTEAICRQFGDRHTNVIYVVAKDDPRLQGKANALAQGIEAARGEVVLITDADCIVPPTWVEGTAARYSKDIGLIGGVTLQRATNSFSGMQSLDWAFILGVAASTAALGSPHGSIGNNLSFRKKAYEEVGGYRNLKFSVTEDYTLVQAIIKPRRWKYLYPIDPSVLVESRPCGDWRTLLRQKHRWGKGGLDMKLSGFLIMAIAFGMHLSPFVMLYWGGVVQAMTALMAKSAADYFFLHRVLRRLGRSNELKYFWWFELYFTLYTLVLPFLVLFGGKVVWKERKY